MLNAQKINRNKAFHIVKANVESLRKSNQTIESIYKIIFQHPNFEFLNIVSNRGVEVITYEQANLSINSFGHFFEETINRESKYVGIYLDNSKEWIYSFFGLLKAGFTPVLFSTANPVEEIKIIGENLGISYLITNKELNLDGFTLVNPFNISEKNSNERFDNEFGNEIVLLTSGTSGTPKIVFILEKNFVIKFITLKNYVRKIKTLPGHISGSLDIL